MKNNLKIRELTDNDLPHIVKIYNSVYVDSPTTSKETNHWFQSFQNLPYICKKYVALDINNLIIAYSIYSHDTIQYHPHKFNLDLVVSPDNQRQGVGSAFYNFLHQEWLAIKAQVIRTMVKEDSDKSIDFVVKRGFREKRRSWESRLNLKEFIFNDFLSDFQYFYSQNLTITTLEEELKLDNNCYQKIYEHHIATMGDMPLPDTYTPVSFEEFMKRVINSPNALPQAFFLAKDGDLYVGESYFETSQADKTLLYQGLTSVRKEYRGKGIATALKLKGIEYAINHNYSTIKTWNDTENLSMLKINQKLGFIRQPALILFENQLNPEVIQESILSDN